MTWEKVPALEGNIHQGCICCPPIIDLAPMNMLVAVGFGAAMVTKDKEVVFDEQQDPDNFHELAEFEEMAKQDPNHDWRVLLHAPLRSREYQRHEEGKWVLIDSGPGFA